MSHQFNEMHNLNEIVYQNAALPSAVFRQSFTKYVFFDLDMATSPELAAGLNGVIESCFGAGDIAEAFSAIGRDRLGTVIVGNEWSKELLEIGQTLRDAGDCGGIILLPTSKRWAVFQRQPVDVGVLALNCGDSLNRSVLQQDGCFFDCEDIIQWIQGNTERDANLRENFGEGLLNGLLENYCNR